MGDPKDAEGGAIDLDKIQADVNEHFIQAGRTSVADTQALLTQSQKALHDAWNYTFEVSQHISTWLPNWTTGTFALQNQRMQDLGTLFHYYQGVLDGGVPEKVYREVTAPLMLGKCYGAPSCTDAVVEGGADGSDEYGAYVLQVPKFAVPYILHHTMEVFLSGAQLEWDRWIEDTVQSYKDAANIVIDTGTDLLKPLLLGVGLVLGVSLVTKYSRTSKRRTS